MTTFYICCACGVQYEASENVPAICKICSDVRQFVPKTGQEWKHLALLQEHNYKNVFVEVEPGLWSIQTYPQVAIGQKAYLIQTAVGNILWDCITYIDQETIDQINKLGGLTAIAISHPHYYSTIVEWGNYFNCPIYLHENDQEWVMRKSTQIHFWKGESLELTEEVTLIHLGGHFEGSSALHWKEGANKRGTLLVGDSIFIVPDSGWVSFIYSAPN